MDRLFHLILFCLVFHLSDSISNATSLPEVTAVYTSRSIVLDGELKEADWRKAEPIYLRNPLSPDSIPSCEVRILWAEMGLYIALKTDESTPVFGGTSAGQSLHQEDVFELFVDPVGDHRQYYEIQMSLDRAYYLKNYVLSAPPRSTRQGVLTSEFISRELWAAATPTTSTPPVQFRSRFHNSIWTIEAFFPATLLGRRRGETDLTPGTWRINFARYDWDLPMNNPARKSQFSYWAPVVPGCPQISPEAMGVLKLQKP